MVKNNTIKIKGGRLTPTQEKMLFQHRAAPHLRVDREQVKVSRLTPMQEGMLFHCLAAPHSGVDVEQVIVTLHEPLDLTSFKRAWQRLMDRHEVLRMRFTYDEKGGARQFPMQGAVLPFEEHDWSALSSHTKEQKFERWLKDDRIRVFDPRSELPVRVGLFQSGPTDWRVVWTWWHGILDGRARLVLLKELFSYYEAFQQGADLDLPLPRRYAEYAEWLASRDVASSAPHWKALLEGFTDPTPVGAECAAALADAGCGRHEMRLSKTVSSRLRVFVTTNEVTMNTLVQAAWALVLGQFSGQDDVVFGNTRACRHSAFDGDGCGKGVVGALINTVPVRVKVQPKQLVIDLLKELRQQHLAVRPHEHTPLVAVQACSSVGADRRLFDSLVVYENASLDSMLREQGGRWENRRFETRGQPGFAATVYSYGEPELLLGIMNDRSRVDDDLAVRMITHLATAMEVMAENPQVAITALPLLPEAERRQVLEDWNRTECSIPNDATIHSSFEDQVARTPEAVALTFLDQSWTFRELDARAENIARRLRAAGAKPETVIGVCLERSLDLVAGMLGVLKTGAAYLPLDPAYPPDRLGVMIKDAQPLWVLSTQKIAPQLSEAKARIFDVDNDGKAVALPMNGSDLEKCGGQNLAYVIYTSGSTGIPKGVMVEHRNVTNFFGGMDSVIGRDPGVWLSVASVSFDISVLEIWWSLTRGFHVVLWPGVESANDATIPDLIRLHKVTHMQCVPSFLRAVMKLPGATEALASLRVQVVGGEEVPSTLIRDLGPSPSRRIIDMYGPTETTVVSTAWEVEPRDGLISIGRPIANTRIFILTPHGQPAPVGVVGELFIGGDGVSRGYLKRPELNSEKFVRSPLAGAEGGRLYRTGDLARYLPDGRLEYIGRVDRQVQVRGHRLELEGIETVLGRHPAVQAGVIDVQAGANDEKRLVAYVVPQNGNMPSAIELREWIGRTLPPYMVPTVFVTLDALPRTKNGKLDREALPSPEAVRDRTPVMNRPPTPLEAGLSEIWCEILGLERVGLDEDFFEVGGNSLMAVHLMLAIEKRYSIKLPLEVLLEVSTVALVAEKLEELISRSLPAAPAGPGVGTERTVPPRTSTERRLLAIWERLLKVRPIGIQDSFIELQEQSTLVDQMLIEIKREFGVIAEGFPVNAFIEEPTIEALARNIDGNVKPITSLLICLQPRGSKPPLFLIHDGGSNIFVYRALAARLGTDRPVYGIRAESNPDGFPFYRGGSMEEVAARYIAEIKTMQPRGPYSLGGACVGGVIAFEMARQLRLKGDGVNDPVLLFDSFVRNNPRLSKEDEIAILQRVGVLPPDTHWMALRRRLNKQLHRGSELGMMKATWHVSGKILRKTPSEIGYVTRAVVRKVRAFPARLADRFGAKVAETPGTPDAVELIRRRLVEEFQPASGDLQAKYVPGVYQGSVVLFKAKDSTNPERLWTGLEQGGMVVHEMPGAHLDMMEEPAVTTTAALVKEHFSPK